MRSREALKKLADSCGQIFHAFRPKCHMYGYEKGIPDSQSYPAVERAHCPHCKWLGQSLQRAYTVNGWVLARYGLHQRAYTVNDCKPPDKVYYI